MDYLLDTHALLWMLDDPAQLPDTAKHVLIDKRNRLFVSTATFWEIAIKINRGSLTLSRSLLAVIDTLQELNVSVLPIKAIQVLPVETRRLYHKDPFDRLIIAQAMVEGYTVVSKDPAFSFYPISVLWD